MTTGTQQEGTEVKVSQLMDTLHESRCTIYNQVSRQRETRIQP